MECEGQINPATLGHISEQYITGIERKRQGAYYTREDITGYICRNTIIPRLFDMLADTGKQGHQAVHPLPIASRLNRVDDGPGVRQGEGFDRYVYPAVKQRELLSTETE